MTDKINKYFEIKNSSIGEYDEEVSKGEKMIALMEGAPIHCDMRYVTRFVCDDGKFSECVFECGYTDIREKAFIIAELQEKYKTKIYAVEETRFEL